MGKISKEKLEELEGKLVYLKQMMMKADLRYNALARRIKNYRDYV
jgi:hypothetical protein